MMTRAARRLTLPVCVLLAPALLASVAHAARPRLMHVVWMKSYVAPHTPARFDQVGVLKIGPAKARNVLVFEPGTSAGSAYIVPLAQWLVRSLPGWQVWSVERRQNLLEDQSVLTRAKLGKASATRAYNYYLENPYIRHSGPQMQVPSSVAFAKYWGLNTAIQDLRVVIRAARRLGGKVVLSGHSLGGALVTAYATWNFGGRAGARDLSGLVFDDGSSFGSAVSPITAGNDLAALLDPKASPWGGVTSIPTPLLGVLSSTGALAAVQQPSRPSVGQNFLLLGPFKPPVPVTNLALFAFNTDVRTSPLGKSDFAILAHEGRGISSRAVGGVHGWDGRGALTPASRWATMLAGPEVAGADGVEWYFPARLTRDIFDSLNNGIATPAQVVLHVHASMGARLPHSLLMYAFGAALGKTVLSATRQLARQSHIPLRNLTLIDGSRHYAHNDPAGAWPHNAFFTGLVHFLRKVEGQG